MKHPRALLLFVTLAACGGGGGSDGAESLRDYGSDSARAAQLVDSTARLTQTAAAAMPTTGSAEYDGIVGMAFGGQPASLAKADLLGEVDLRANFATGRVTGELDDFHTADGRELEGELRLGNGRIRGSEFDADLDGRLTGGGNAPGAVSGRLDGRFLGAGADALSGTGTGTSDQGGLGMIFRGERDRD